MLQNDTTIKKSPALFKQYNAARLYGSDPSTTGGQNDPVARDPGGGSNPAQNMALQGMENLIRPIANNIIAIQTALDSPQLRTGTGRPEDDQQLQEIRDKLFKALATQNASLDIISGFVDTQQMADLQHAGEAYISSISTARYVQRKDLDARRPIRSKRTRTTPAFRPIRTTSTWRTFRA